MGSTTEAERAARRREVAKRLRLGESYAEIADALGVAKSTVSRDVRRLKEQWRKNTTKDMDRHMDRRLAELRAIKREAYEGWLDSKEGPAKKRVRRKEEGGASEEVTRQIIRTAGGDAQHLRAMLDAETKIQKLLGLHEYEADTEGDRLDDLVSVIEQSAEEADMSQFEDEEIR
jgi:transposase